MRTAIMAAAMVAAFPAAAQERAPVEAARYPAPQTYPNENRAAVAEHLALARRYAGSDLFQDMAHRCIVSPMFPVRVQGIQFDGKITPTKVFDQLYSVGQNAVSAYALDTSDGIVVFDALNNADEAKTLLVPNMVALGMDPKRIRYVVVTHGHGDHYGGARHLQDTYGAKVIASAVDWDLMEATAKSGRGPFRDLPIPRRDMAVADGQVLTLGATRLTFYVTPGHTPGTLSIVFPVTDRGRPHVVGLFGGTGGGRDPQAIRAQVVSLDRWAGLAQAAGVDTLIANHPLHDEGLEKEELLRYRRAGDANPFVIGADAYRRYVMVQKECGLVQLGRLGFAK